MWFMLCSCAVATILLMLGHAQSSSDLQQLPLHLRYRLVGEVLVRITKEEHFTKNISLSDITFDTDSQTTVVFTHLWLLGTDVEVTRIVGDYEIESNDVQQIFPRTGHLNVTFSELLKKDGWEPLASSQQLPPTGGHTTILNDVIDFMLLVVQDVLKETGRDEIQIPNINESFSHGRFIAEDGQLKSLTTVHRTSNTLARVAGMNLSVVCRIGLQTLQARFRHYEARLSFLYASGEITIKVPNNSVTLNISLAYVNEKCIATLESLVTQLDGIDVKINGWNHFNFLLSAFVNFLSWIFRDKIATAVNDLLSNEIKNLLSQFHCEEYFQQIHKQQL